jgi:hypothetical protein
MQQRCKLRATNPRKESNRRRRELSAGWAGAEEQQEQQERAALSIADNAVRRQRRVLR